MTVIEELVTILGIDVDGQAMGNLKKFTGGIDSITKYAAIASAALTAASSAIIYFTKEAAAGAAEIDKFSQLTGLATDTIQEWSFAAEQAGGDAQSLTSDLDSLTRSMSSPIPGEFNQALFMLGVNAKDAQGNLKDADKVLLEIADKMEGMSTQHQLQWGSKIGLSDDTIRLLQLGRDEIEKMKQQARDIPTIVDKESLKNAREFTTQLKLMQRVITYLSQEVSSAAGPAFKEMMNSTLDWIKANREFIQLGMKKIITGIVEGFKRYVDLMRKVKQAFFDLMPWLEKITSTFDDFGGISAIVFSALTALAVVTAILAAKFIAIAAVIVAAGLVLEDFLTWLEGGDSIFGDFIDGLDDLWQAFSTKFPAIADLVTDLIDVIKDLGIVVSGYVMDYFEGLWAVIKKVSGAIGKIISLIAGETESFLKDKGFGVTQNVNMVTQPSHSVPASMQSSHGGNTFNVTNNIAGDNAPAVASETTRKMKFSLQQTYPGGLAPVVN